ncbi:MAG: DUF262 domain-containing protein [Tannerellaceae bacterium]|nr:DUF262 domain-containing protein [Tannerellaceae bacterium]
MADDNQKTKFEEHTFKTFLNKYHVVIPMVQRDYAQGRTDDNTIRVRSRFLDAISNHLSPESTQTMKMDFVYGEVDSVWSKTEVNKLEALIVTPLDGQQRLTTLYLLHWYAAKIAKVESQEYHFLYNFTYDVRPSSRDFCNKFVEYIPDMQLSLKEQIPNQPWFQAEWKNDATVIGMLEMLDSIQLKFAKRLDLWKVLTEENRIGFIFLPLSENGQSDELYIKMNSRGKELTSFEHFKAEFESLYDHISSSEKFVIEHKFDVEWTDMLFPYRNPRNNTIDSEWLRLFKFISHVICYKQGLERINDELNLIELLYALPDSKHPYRNPNAKQNQEFLEKALDSWAHLESIDNFFKEFLCLDPYAEDYSTSKVCTYKKDWKGTDCQNYLYACCKYYSDSTYYFSLGDFVFLYGITFYLINKDKISERDFRKRLRVLRNLIMASSNELRNDSDIIQDILAQTESIILSGNISRDGRKYGFNEAQITEEGLKQAQDFSPEMICRCNHLEDHPLLYGYISSVGIKNLDLEEAFYEVFSHKHNRFDVHKALLSIGDYCRRDRERYYMGNHNERTWEELLHASRRGGFKTHTSPTLIALLKSIKAGKTIEDIISSFIQECEDFHTYPWRYYFVKYPVMLYGQNGNLGLKNGCQYQWITLNRIQYNGKHWNSFALAIKDEFILRASQLDITLPKSSIMVEDYDIYLKLPFCNGWLECIETGFILHQGDKVTPWPTIQEVGQTDSFDRVDFCVNKLLQLYHDSRPSDQ